MKFYPKEGINIEISNIITLVCGIAMFMFGMNLMGDGLKKVAGSKLEVFLGKLTNTPIKGILLGTGITAVIQSSSATSVMAVGFVNSGMMKFRQAIGIILGAILGTSVTGWIISLSSISGGTGLTQILSTSTITAIIAVVGIILRTIKKTQTKINISDIMMGFAILMLGMSLMSSSVNGLKENSSFISMLTAFAHPVIGILVGIVFTAVLQSASAAVGILQALTATGVITFGIAFPLIMGIGIGAALPVLISAIGANTAGKRTAFVYLLIDVAGAVVCGSVFYIANLAFSFPFTSAVMTTFTVALLNTLFRLAEVIVLSPAIGIIDRLTCLIIKDREKDEKKGSIIFEDRFLPYPSLAVSQCNEAMNKMVRDTFDCFISSQEVFKSFSDSGYKRVVELEDITDEYEDSIGTYLMKITRVELNAIQNSEVTKMMHTLSDFERIADHSLGIAKMCKEMDDSQSHFSPDGMEDFAVLEQAVSDILSLTVSSFIENNYEAARSIEALNKAIETLCDKVKSKHVDRLRAGSCSLALSPIFNNLLNDYERIAAHCSNIGLAIIGLKTESMDMHNINKTETGIMKKYNANLEKYSL